MVRQAKQAPNVNVSNGVTHGDLPLALLDAHPRNYRHHPGSQVERLAASAARFGQVRSIVVQAQDGGRYTIVAGHGFVRGAAAVDLTTVHADIIPADWSQEQVDGYLVADNESAKGAEDDLVELATLLQEQANAGHDLTTMGSSATDLEALLAQLDEMTAVDVDDDADDAESDVGASERDAASGRASVVQALIPVASLAVIEQALRATGEQNRGKALATVCAAYVDALKEEA